MQNCSFLALKLRKKFEITSRGRKQKKERVVIAKLIDCDFKVEMVSGGLAWAPCNRIGFGFGLGGGVGRVRVFSMHKKYLST